MKAEVFDFLSRARKQEARWDLIVADPPPVPTAGRRRSRSRGKRGRGFDPSADLARLLQSCRELLASGGQLLACSALRGERRFEGQLPTTTEQGTPVKLRRGSDFPGPDEEGLRAWVLQA